MKALLYLAIVLLVTIGCKAQILDISQDKGLMPPLGTYYKDINNKLDVFVGTYILEQNSTTLKFIFQKKTASNAANGHYKEDLIIGEYLYIKNGILMANTLEQLNTALDDASNYNISGNLILTGQSWGCNDCSYGEIRLSLGISDNVTNNYGDIELRPVIINGVAAMKIYVTWQSKPTSNGVVHPRAKLPDGEYILLKQ